MNLNSFDLNLLRVFNALLKERSVTRAGERIGLSQPAVSSALNRLRHIFQDDLFIRSGSQMVPTPRASCLASPISAALESLEAAFLRYFELEPAKLQRSYTLLGADFFSMLFVPKLSTAITTVAPGVRLRLFDSSRGDVAHLLREGTIDIALEHLAVVPEDISSAYLFRSCFVVVANARNGAVRELGIESGQVLPLGALNEFSFAVYSLDGGDTGCAVEALRNIGLVHRVAIALPHFHSTALAAAEGDFIALVPCQFAEAIAARYDLSIYRMPMEMPAVEIRMYWHARADEDLQHAWLRERIIDTARTLAFDGCAERYLVPV
ncbi:LysR family transcriptional regulator [Chelativorans sp. YIM 93263]|uniref:LysR family transcriptional regulator n=1 Tax=Chelativorans sp. YIM 93263 TaxID=2906648 RepID=UPI0023787453|nr:LysR family transcriptional regulator [Chelativorans sp. YIM 93263]